MGDTTEVVTEGTTVEEAMVDTTVEVEATEEEITTEELAAALEEELVEDIPEAEDSEAAEDLEADPEGDSEAAVELEAVSAGDSEADLDAEFPIQTALPRGLFNIRQM
ncbi:uncharacterized protein LOC122266838 isoform X8 [Penaeus japonicus]|uniref:uncharacterized protein LOC122266838 isoform X8 n=1 Tax=Penaeus japonicus TaxID=27405 RepID=UPI001C70E535|nr:uncharacterized protein LOC122266838 isoform X8 [Penaeus japonicus]